VYCCSITNFLFKDNSGFSEKTLSFFRKESLKDFFLLSKVPQTTNFVGVLVKKDTNNFIWNKTDSMRKLVAQKNNVESSGLTYIYKPESLVTPKSSFECLYLRKCKNFNKGRYSRNRQVYRTGVYMCFYINVIALYALWFYFYKFKFKFTYF
jgi:hypothetical protein